MEFHSKDDMELLQLMKQNNEKAFAEIYSRYWKVLYYTANNIIQNEMASQDIVQVIFISLWERRNEVDISSLKAYLQQATRFQVYKAIREQKTDADFFARLTTVTASIIYDNPLVYEELESWLRQTMDALPEDCRHIFKLSREEHLTYRQIANQLDISEKTVEKKMTICLKHIRKCLQEAPELLLTAFMVLCFTTPFFF